MEEELHALVVDGLLAGVDDALQHEVSLLQLVPEEEIVLRKEYAERVSTLGKIGTQHVESAEHPATAAGLLVGDGLFLGLYAKIGIQDSRILAVLCQIINSVGCQRIAQGTVRGRGGILLFYLLQHLRTDATLFLLC